MINFKEQASIVLINQPTLLTNMAGKNIQRENHLKLYETYKFNIISYENITELISIQYNPS